MLYRSILTCSKHTRAMLCDAMFKKRKLKGDYFLS